MGNCLKCIDPLFATPRIEGIDITPVTESGLPIIFLIGGPGAGKRTQSIQVARRYGFLNIVTRDLLRDEMAASPQKAATLAHFLPESRLVPSDILVELIKSRMLSGLDTARGFLLSGFPLVKEHSKYFDRHVRPPDLVLYVCVRNSVMIDRILARIVTATERHQRHFEEIKQQIKMFNKQSKPILRHYSKKLCVIDGEKEESIVLEDICEAIDNILKDFPSSSTVRSTK